MPFVLGDCVKYLAILYGNLYSAPNGDWTKYQIFYTVATTTVTHGGYPVLMSLLGIQTFRSVLV